MSFADVEWLPATLALAFGLVLAAWAVAVLRQKRATEGEAPSETALVDLEERAAQLVQLLRDLDEQKARLDAESYIAQKALLEKRAADAMRARDERYTALRGAEQAHAKKKVGDKVDKKQGAKAAAPRGFFAERPALKGFLYGALTVGVGAGIFGLLLAEQKPRAEGGSLTGNAGEPAMGGQGRDPELTALLDHLKRSPNDVEAVARLVHRLIDLEMFKEAMQVNEHAKSLDANRPDTKVHSATLRAVGGDVPGARGDFDAVVKAHPDFAEAWLYRGFFALQLNDTLLAKESFEKFVAVAPPGPDRSRIEEFLKGGMQMPGQGAGSAAPVATAGSPAGSAASPAANFDALLEQTRVFLRQQRIDEAAQLNAQARAIAPEHPEVRVHAAVIRGAKGDTDAALRELDQVLAQEPKLADGWFFRGMLGMITQRPELTKESWEKFVAVAPEGPRKERIKGFLRGDGLQMPQ